MLLYIQDGQSVTLTCNRQLICIMFFDKCSKIVIYILERNFIYNHFTNTFVHIG